ncbi:MAG: cupin domain-containing protein [Treponema sp.]|jgi:quercetin dioxygenase-like cupin family protein|nr:cupin domain-containing protein [Treponema sp.]
MEILYTDQAPAIKVNDRILQWIVAENGPISSNHCSCCIVQFEPGASAKPPHSHPDCEESIYILSGSGEMVLKGGESKAVKAGSFLLMRINEVHLLRNTGDTKMKALCFYSSPTDNSKYDFYPMEIVEKE